MLKGGIANKLGNDYEALWTLTEALRVLLGQADEIRIEPFNEDAKGLEFRVTAGARNTWHQCKRRLQSGSWTIKALESEGVLRDFARKLADSANDCVFVSSDPAPTLKELSGKAAIVDNAAAFRDSLSRDDQVNLQALATAWSVDSAILFDWLRRVRVETVSDASLKRELIGFCQLLFTVLPVRAVERLASFLNERVTHVLTTEALRAGVDSLGLGWHARFDPTLKEKLTAATDRYLGSLGQPIAGEEIVTSELTDAVVAALAAPGRITIVSGSAGSGKSLTLARIVAAARNRGWPVLGFRIDWFLDARAVVDIGADLVARDENPVAVLGNHAGNGDCLLLIDQVDAVSEASGRSGRIRDVAFQMINAARYYRGLRVVVACRTYDLNNDSRLKALEKEAKAVPIRLKPLDWTAAVKPVLQKLGLGGRSFSVRQREILSVPINLQIFATLATAGEVTEGDLTGAQLFDRLLELRARELRRAGIVWPPHAALTRLAEWMSENQVLTAPVSVLANFPGAADTLSSNGLVNKAGSKIQFAHESFFDHVFSADFARRGDNVLAFLKSDQQKLFRRTQVRQILARLRDQSTRSYLANLREVMDSMEVRYLIKDAVAVWLASVDAPSQAELDLVDSWWERGRPYELLARIVVNGRGWLPLLIHSGAIARWIETAGSSRDLAFWLIRKGVPEHARVVSTYLRSWWRGDAARASDLLAWFNNLHPDGSIGELEALYFDLIEVAPPDTRFDANFELGAWVHKDRGLGARVLGRWLTRWMAVFPDSHPFARNDTDSGYWSKELAHHVPMSFLDAVWPALVEGIRRERLALAAKRLDYPTIRLDHCERDAWILLVNEALTKASLEMPKRVETWLDVLAPDAAPALWLHLRAIAANAPAFHRRLPALLGNPNLFNLGEHGAEWRPFAEAAQAAIPFLGEEERRLIEDRIMAHRPEYERARRVIAFAREDGREPGTDDRVYACRLLSRSGEVERAILVTIGGHSLGPIARRRLSELQRKFRDQPLPEAHGIRGGFVRSPISLEKTVLMTNSQWLAAVKRYSGGEEHIYERDGVIGGAEQLANVLQARVKEQPERFVKLLESFGAETNLAYPRAVIRGLRDANAEDGAAFAIRAFHAAELWGRNRFWPEIGWLVEKFPEIGRDTNVLGELLAAATLGEASDTSVRTNNPKEKTDVQGLLSGSDDLENSGINGERGVAWRAIAAVLWVERQAFEPVATLLESCAEIEPLTSVRMCMFDAVNAVLKYDLSRGLALLKRLAVRDLTAVHSSSGRDVLRWAAYNHTAEVQPILDGLTASNNDSMRALGLALEAGLALNDDAREAAFSASFAEDVLRRRVAALVAAGNLTSDRVGERAGRWLQMFVDDAEAEVRKEAAQVDWESLLDGRDDHSDLAAGFLRSPLFADHPDDLMRALETRIDGFPELTFDAVTRLLRRDEHVAVPDHNRYSWAIDNAGRFLVALYRAFEGDEAREERLLDVFDTYLASDLRDLGEEIRAYERH